MEVIGTRCEHGDSVGLERSWVLGQDGVEIEVMG